VPDGENVVQFGELALHLLQTGLIGNEQQHAACGPVVDGHADNGLEMKPRREKRPVTWDMVPGWLRTRNSSTAVGYADDLSFNR